MKTWIQHLGERLRTSFWFVPAVFVSLAITLAIALNAIDDRWGEQLIKRIPEMGQASPGGLRDLMGAAATSMLTLAGITFSGTLVALTLASSQFGPRLLRNFIRSRPNQITLAMLLSTFVYCLMTMRSIRDAGEGAGLPHLTALGGFLGTLASLAVFIYFIHHISTSLQADRVAAAVHADLCASIQRFFPASMPSNEDERAAESESDDWEELEDEAALCSREDGYLQAVDLERLVKLCRHHELRCRVLKRPGHHVAAEVPLLALDGGEPDEETAAAFLGCFLIGSQRTPEQDFEYEIQQLVEVALRALSPGINDPFTAMTCIDYLGSALGVIAGRRLPRRIHRDADGGPRVRTRPVTFESLTDAAFHQLRQTGADKPAVMIRLLDVLTTLAARCRTSEQLKAVERHVDLIERATGKAIRYDDDRDAIAQRVEIFRKRAAQPSEK